METPKLKNIILIILVITNLCLLVLVGRSEWKDDYLRWQTRAEAIDFLDRKQVQVDEAIIPHEVALQPGRAERDLEQEGRLAVQLLGGPVERESRGAGVYRYENDLGFIQFHSDGAFQAEFVPGAFPVGEDGGQACLDLLNKLEFEGCLESEEGGQRNFLQLWQGHPLFICQVTVEEKAGCLTSLTSGRRLVGQPTLDNSRQTITIPTALICLFNGINVLGDVCSRIDAIDTGYVTSSALSGSMAITPVWRVTTDTGLYQLDLVTGNLIRIS